MSPSRRDRSRDEDFDEGANEDAQVDDAYDRYRAKIENDNAHLEPR